MFSKEIEMRVHNTQPQKKNCRNANVGTRDDVEKCFASDRQLQGQDSIVAERSKAWAHNL